MPLACVALRGSQFARTAHAALFLATLAAAEGAAHADTLVLTPLDAQATTNDGALWTLDTASTTLNASTFASTALARRGILEFNLAGLPAGATINSAHFDYRISSFTSGAGQPPPELQFHGYAGNGILEAADATRPFNLIGSNPDVSTSSTFSTPFTPGYVQSLVGTTPYLGVLTYRPPSGQAAIYSSDYSIAAYRPTLTIDFTPAIPVPNLYVSGEDASLREYAGTGTLVRTLPVPYPGGTRPATEDVVRGTAVDWQGRVHVYNGTFLAHLTTYNSGTWSHRSEPGLSVTNTVSNGAPAAFGSYVFAPDQRTFLDAQGPLNGIVRFDTRNNTAVRFGGSDSSAGDVTKVARGLDGLLYALTGGTDTHEVRVYNPYSMALIRTVTLPQGVRGIAVNAAGEMYGTTWGGTLYKYNASGAVLDSRFIGGTIDGIDLAANGSIVVGSWTSGVYLTNESLAPPTQIINGTLSNNFVTFKDPITLPGWKVSASGQWTNAANWQGAVPNGPGAIATFGPANTGTMIVTLPNALTLGTLNIDESAGHYVFSGTTTATITLDSTSGPAIINVVSGNIPMAFSYTLADDAIVRFPQFTTLETGNFGKLDLTTHALIWDYAGSNPLNLNDLLKRGYNDGQWNGTGGVMTSSVAAADAAHATAVGYAEAASLGITSFRGIAVDSTTLIYAYTWLGDANLDGVVDALDVARMDPAGTDWSHGDFNFDGTVNGDDWILLNYGLVYGTTPITSVVPEPALPAVVVVGLAALPLRRRKARLPS